MCLFWILGEPAFFDALLLLKELENAPEAGTTDDSKDGAEHVALNAEACCDECNSGERESPPASGAEMVFAFDYDGMEHSYYHESSNCYHQTCIVHSFPIIKVA